MLTQKPQQALCDEVSGAVKESRLRNPQIPQKAPRAAFFEKAVAVLFRPIDGASLAFFRIAFGALLLWEVYRYYSNNWIESHWLEPIFHFTYFGFDWIKPWPGNGLFWHFGALGVLAAAIALGFFYRISATLFFLGFSYVFLLDQAEYLNHFYLICLISFLLIFLPAHHQWSFDAWHNPVLRHSQIPTWALWLLRAQLGIVYFYAGLAKLHPDWLQGEPMRLWLSRRTDFPILGPYFKQEWMVYAMSYGGLCLDLFIVFLLLWPRTRTFAFLLAVFFHFLNDQLFSIGVFPYFMVAATTLFLPPDWPRRAFRFFKRLSPQQSDVQNEQKPFNSSPRQIRLIVAGLALYLTGQLLFPLRHYLYPGDVHWTEEGHRFSWRMKLRTKRGKALFFLKDPTIGRQWTVQPETYLVKRQASKMADVPDMVLQFSHFLAQEARRQGHREVEVRARVLTSLNGRRPQLIIDPKVNLAAQPRSLASAPCILPLKMPLQVHKTGISELNS